MTVIPGRPDTERGPAGPDHVAHQVTPRVADQAEPDTSCLLVSPDTTRRWTRRVPPCQASTGTGHRRVPTSLRHDNPVPS